MPNLSLQIRPASPPDLDALQAIGRKTFAETFSANNSEENLAAYLAEGFSEEKLEAELRNENSQFYFALQKEEIIGYLKVNMGDAQSEKQDPNALEIERIYVLQQYHGKQVGLLLYEQALAIAKERKAPYMWLGVWEENPRAIRFYQKQGFVEFGEHIFQLGDEAQRDVLMKKMLPDLFEK
jgi:ribosomal protein S18 acetylase RimI-like enzyme